MKTLNTATIVALAALTIGGNATASLANTKVVTRGPNGAAFVVKADRIPLDAKQQPNTEAHDFPQIVTRGPGGAGHIKGIHTPEQGTTAVATPEIINRGPNGGGQIK